MIDYFHDNLSETDEDFFLLLFLQMGLTNILL